MKDINEYFADKCGVRCTREDTDKWYYPDWHPTPATSNGCHEKYKWSIENATCREVIREKFFIENEYDYLGTWTSFISLRKGCVGHGKTIVESELACLKAIYDIEKTL